jgi:AcrR family transcriptional regulator
MSSSNEKKIGRPSLTVGEKEAIQQNIITIAKKLFLTQGIESISMRNIATKAGFAPTKIYYYFKNKKAILNHFWSDISSDMWRYVSMKINHNEPSPFILLSQLMELNITYWLTHSNNYQLLMRKQDGKESVNDHFSRQYTDPKHPYNAQLLKAIDSCFKKGIFKNESQQFIQQSIVLSIFGIYGSFYNLPHLGWNNKKKLIRVAIDSNLKGFQN